MSPGVVGMPVEAMDPDDDALTYSLDDDSGNFTLVMVDHDNDANTDMVGTAQIIVAEGTADDPVELNYEAKRTFMVELTASDGALESSVMVTITLMDMNEAPGMPTELSAALVISGPEAPAYEENGMDAVGRYSAAGADAASAVWSLSGDDMGAFEISAGGELTFMSDPDYEMPSDMGTNNMYEFTVMANDGTNTDSLDVTVTVTNMNEMGRVTFWRDGADATTSAIMVGDMLTGLAEDPDGNPGDMPPITDMYTQITNVTWQWDKSMDMTTWTPIPGATNAAYTVMEATTGTTCGRRRCTTTATARPRKPPK